MKNTYLLGFAFILTTTLYSQTIVRKVRPSSTDPLITTYDADSHYVYIDPTVVHKNILVVHLPGSNSEPFRYSLLGTHAAGLGFHSIGLMYPNSPAVASLCGSSTDPDCFENVRREIIDGIDYSSSITINGTECILNRLKKLLIYLTTNYPGENWGQYLDINQNLVFNKIILSGSSQGGGHASLAAKYYQIKRAVCFSSPKDYSVYFNAPPAWYSTGNWQTSKSELYCFNHTQDNHTFQLEIWDSLGIDNYGPPVSVDTNSSPFSNSRQLTTSYTVPAGDAHGCTSLDNKTPKTGGGVPVFLPVWTYMLTGNIATGLSVYTTGRNSTIRIYPNPTNDITTVNVQIDQYSISIYNIKGIKIKQYNNVTGNFKINFSEFSPDLYFIYATNGEKTVTGKLFRK